MERAERGNVILFRIPNLPAPPPGIDGDAVPVQGSHVAYLSDFDVFRGASTLFRQKDAIDAWSLLEAVPLDGYRVDSGRPAAGATIGPALCMLVDEVKSGRVAIVAVLHVTRFSPDLATAYRIAISLLEAGAEIHEAAGGRLRVECHVEAPLARMALRARCLRLPHPVVDAPDRCGP